jgi:hypothetical protein
VFFHSVLQGYRNALCSRIIADLYPDAMIRVLLQRRKCNFSGMPPATFSRLPGKNAAAAGRRGLAGAGARWTAIRAAYC